MRFTDEMLMAYADSQLDPAEAAELERALALDASLAERLAQMAGARQAVRQAFDPAPPVAATLEARVRAMIAGAASARPESEQPWPEGPNVVALAARRRVVPFWQVPLAAGLALAIGAGSVWLTLGRGGEGPGPLRLAQLDDPAIVSALDGLPSGRTVDLGAGVRLVTIATFRDADDRLCREFEHDRSGSSVMAVACNANGAWDLRFALAAASTGGDGYAPASSLETLDAYLASTGAGAPLSPDDEAAALKALN